MRAVVQRVSNAKVTVDGTITGAIGDGVLILLGVRAQDTEADAAALADKILQLRIFADDDGKLNRSVLDCGGGVLVVSQFTLYGDCRKGRRPSFDRAAAAPLAKELYEFFVACCRRRASVVHTGEFQAHMDVELCNDGPVTLLLDSEKIF